MRPDLYSADQPLPGLAAGGKAALVGAPQSCVPARREISNLRQTDQSFPPLLAFVARPLALLARRSVRRHQSDDHFQRKCTLPLDPCARSNHLRELECTMREQSGGLPTLGCEPSCATTTLYCPLET